MTSKFEQLIEYVINDEEAKAKELFHDIVVEKSREIYENLMNEEEEDLDEAKEEEEAEEELEESAEEELDEASEEELDENMVTGEEELEDSIEAEEQGMAEGEEEEVEFGAEEGNDEEAGEEAGEEDLEDRVVDLEDKLDELMAEFESLMGAEEEEHSDLAGADGEELGGDAMAQDDTMAFDDEAQMMEEAVQLDKVPAPTHGDDGANTKSPVTFNSGAKGMQGSPVKMTGDTAQGRSAPGTKDLPEAGKFKNVPGKGTANSKLAAAPKPVTAQASGVNTKSPVTKA